MMERHYEPLDAYRQSKLAQILYTFDLAERLRDDNVTVNALHPASLMPTKMVHEYFGRTIDTLEDGVRSVLHLAVDPSVEGTTGQYFDHLQEAQANPQAYDLDARRQLQRLSFDLTTAETI
jgi:NAD(P)-dependent dehydrogenase (short-subunit alcohol dehydrogenase family)